MADSPQPKKIAALYGRVSTDEQVEGFSLENQERLCRELADREGYTIHSEGFISDDGFSGYELERPGLIKLRQLAQSKIGSPGTAVMGYKYNRATEHPCEMIAAQVHGGNRYGQCHSGSAELARGSRPLHTENRARALAHPRREHR